MISYKTDIEVRYAETDQMGVVHHSKYLIYCELGRVQWLNNLGLSYAEMERNGTMLPVVSVSLNYKFPTRFGEKIYVITELKKIPTSKIIFDYLIFNLDDRLLVEAQTTLVFVDKATNRPTRPPEFFMEKLAPYFKELQ